MDKIYAVKDFDTIYRQFSDSVFRVCYMYFKGSRMDAEDACQTTFLKLFNSKKEFEGLEHSKAWLIKTASHVCISELRRRKPTSPIDEESAVDSGEMPEENTVLKQVMSLPEGYRVPVYMFYYEDMTAKQISKATGVTEATVFWRLSRARQMLKEILLDG